MNLFDYQDYRQFLRDSFKRREGPKKGQLGAFSQFLRVHSSLTSHVLRGEKDFNLEHAFRICDFFNFSQIERRYFFALINFARAGTVDLKHYFIQEMDLVKKAHQEIAHRIKAESVLDKEAERIFYSTWKYSALRLGASLKKIKTSSDLAQMLNLDDIEVSAKLQFLEAQGLIVRDTEVGGWKLGHLVLHLPKNSPLAAYNHAQWRMRSLTKFERLQEEDFCFTAPLTISKKDAKMVREKLLQFLEYLKATVENSPGEELYQVNLDWIKI